MSSCEVSTRAATGRGAGDDAAAGCGLTLVATAAGRPRSMRSPRAACADVGPTGAAIVARATGLVALERLVGDVTDPDTMRRAVHGCDTVFHLAAIYALWLPRPERMLSVNVGGMQTVLRACADAGKGGNVSCKPGPRAGHIVGLVSIKMIPADKGARFANIF